jgi:hypothetical protein
MKKSISSVVSLILVCAFLSSCAYRYGSPERRIPGGYHLIAVPVFKNKTQEVSIESFFTHSMIMEIEKSSLAQVTSKEESQAILLGEISNVEYVEGTEITPTTQGYHLPQNTVLAKEYRIKISAQIKLVRSSDMAVLWEGAVAGEKRYPAPVITKTTLNAAQPTANPLYNQSARILNIQQVSQDMMTEAYERLTENF